MIDQRFEAIKDIERIDTAFVGGDNGFSGGHSSATVEDAKAAQDRLLDWRKEIVTPIERRFQGCCRADHPQTALEQ